MKIIRKDRTASLKKELMQLEDWTDFETAKPYVIAVYKDVGAKRPLRIAFEFDDLSKAQTAFDGIMLGASKLNEYKRYLVDAAMERYL